MQKNYRENSNGYLFANQNGKSTSVGKATEYGLWPVQKVLNIERTGLHAFRHAAASELLEEGAPLTVVSSFIVLSPLSVRRKQVMHGWHFPTFEWSAKR